jgi:outer membrane protein OmpA-like peptidoglycan-associated protein
MLEGGRKMKKTISIFVAGIFMMTLLSCAGATRQQKGTATGAAIGGVIGAGLGQAIGRDTKGTLIGAGIGAALGGIAGNQIAAYMDRQEQELRGAMAESDAVNIQRTQDVLSATFKGDIFFGTNSSTLKPGAYSEIDRISNVLNNYPQTTIRVEGHTDSTGPADYNQRLSEKRAETVKNALVQRAVDSRRINAVGYGESQPISSDNATNRRVSIVIVPIQQG